MKRLDDVEAQKKLFHYPFSNVSIMRSLTPFSKFLMVLGIVLGLFFILRSTTNVKMNPSFSATTTHWKTTNGMDKRMSYYAKKKLVGKGVQFKTFSGDIKWELNKTTKAVLEEYINADASGNSARIYASHKQFKTI
jgi:hypothetical protein